MKKIILLAGFVIGFMSNQAQSLEKHEGLATNNAPSIVLNGNQVNDEVKITFHLSKPSVTTCSILDLIGKPVKTFATIQDSGTSTMVYAVPELQNGLYFISIQTPEVTVTRRLIVQR